MNAIAEPTHTAESLWERTRAVYARMVALIGAAAAIAALVLTTRAARREIAGSIALLEHVVRKLLFAEASELYRKQLEAEARKPRIEIVAFRSLGMAKHYAPPDQSTPPRTAPPRAEKAASRATAVRPIRIPDPIERRVPAPRKLRSAASPAPERETFKPQRSIDLERPETWRAQFLLSIPPDPRRLPDSRAPRIRPLWGPPPSLPLASPFPPPAPRRRLSHAFRLARRFEAVRRVLDDPLPHARRLAGRLARVRRSFPGVVDQYLYATARTSAYDRRDPRLSIEAWAFAMDRKATFSDSS